jgi:hypothetical protein
VVNLFAGRCQKPQQLRCFSDPFCHKNDAILAETAAIAKALGIPILCAWGTKGRMFDADQRALAVFKKAGVRLVCLDKTQKNIGFPLRQRRAPAATIRAEVDRALEMVRMPGYGARYPRQLSGGQQQRVALARAVVFPPARAFDGRAVRGARQAASRQHAARNSATAY